MLAVLVNGVECIDPGKAIAVSDRGLNYGDGLFETMALQGGRVRLQQAHLARLASGCERLGIDYPGDALLTVEIERVCHGHEAGIVKLVVTRGAGGRGYRPSANVSPTRILSLHEPVASGGAGIRVRWCETRLARYSAVAGIKHLNRLEQVLAQREWNDASIEEGLMLDSEGELVCATAANVFIVRGQEIATPDLRYCGIRGVMRAEVIRLARALGLMVREAPLWPQDVYGAQEVFITNAVRGIRWVEGLEQLSWSRGPITLALCEALARCEARSAHA